MKTNAKEYLRDVAFKRIHERLGFPDYIYAEVNLVNALSNNELIAVKSRGGFAIQITDRREQYEERKKRAELSGLGF